MDVRAYYAQIREQERVLNAQNPSGFVFVTSTQNMEKNTNAGSVAEVSNYTAARHIVERTARIATTEEVAVFHETARQFKARMQPSGQSRKGQIVLVLDDKATRQ